MPDDDNNPLNCNHSCDIYKMRVIINFLFHMEIIVDAPLCGNSKRATNLFLSSLCALFNLKKKVDRTVKTNRLKFRQKC